MVFFVDTGKKRVEINLPFTSTVKDLKVSFAKQTKKSIHRLSFKLKDLRIDEDSKTLAEFGIKDETVIVFKDLGPQIGYRTVFLCLC